MKRGQIQSAITQTRVLQVIRERKEASRIEISRALSMDRSTITHVINDLLKRGLIKEERGISPKKSGRKPVRLSLSGSYGSILGMEIQPGLFRIVLMDTAGRILLSETDTFSGFPLPVTIVSGYLEKRDLSSYPPLLGVALALPGTVDPYQNRLIESLSMGLKELKLPERIGDFPLLADNDANCYARSLLHSDTYGHVKNMLCLWGDSHRFGKEGLTARDDIGAGLILNGSVYYGSHCLAGEPGGTPFYSKPMAALVSPEEEKEYLNALLSSFENTLYLLDPDIFHIGGDLASLEKDLWALKKFSPARCEIRFGRDSLLEAARGSALLFLDQLYTPGPPGSAGNSLEQIRWENLPLADSREDNDVKR